MTKEQIWKAIEAYRKAGGSEEHFAWKNAIGAALDEVLNATGVLQARVVELDAEIEALRADAESWRQYKARKDAVIAAGMGRNPLRTEAQRKSDAFDSLPDDYEVN